MDTQKYLQCRVLLGKIEGMNIPNEAVEVAAEVLFDNDSGDAVWDEVRELIRDHYRNEVKSVLEAAAPYMHADAELMRWKLDALKEWSDAMVAGPRSPQYGRDVRSLLEVRSMDEAREIDAL